MFGKKLFPYEEKKVQIFYELLDVIRPGITNQMNDLVESNSELIAACQSSTKGQGVQGDGPAAISPESIKKIEVEIQSMIKLADMFKAQIEEHCEKFLRRNNARTGAIEDILPKKAQKVRHETLLALGIISNFLESATEGLSEPNPLINTTGSSKLNLFKQSFGMAHGVLELITKPIKR